LNFQWSEGIGSGIEKPVLGSSLLVEVENKQKRIITGGKVQTEGWSVGGLTGVERFLLFGEKLELASVRNLIGSPRSLKADLKALKISIRCSVEKGGGALVRDDEGFDGSGLCFGGGLS
jgi:hypothetical protein